MSNPAIDWLDGKISVAKMLELAKVPLGVGDDLAGLMWQACHEKLAKLRADFQHQIDLSERDYKEATDEKKHDSMTSESARRRAWTEAKSKLQFHFGGCIDRTMAAR